MNIELIISLISLLVSLAAFWFEWYILKISRKDRDQKKKLIEDYTVAQTLFEIRIEDYFDSREKESYNALSKLYVLLTELHIYFNHTATNKNFELLLDHLVKLIKINPMVVGRICSKSGDETSDDYEVEVSRFTKKWKSFIHKLKIRTSIKDL